MENVGVMRRSMVSCPFFFSTTADVTHVACDFSKLVSNVLELYFDKAAGVCDVCRQFTLQGSPHCYRSYSE